MGRHTAAENSGAGKKEEPGAGCGRRGVLAAPAQERESPEKHPSLCCVALGFKQYKGKTFPNLSQSSQKKETCLEVRSHLQGHD